MPQITGRSPVVISAARVRRGIATAAHRAAEPRTEDFTQSLPRGGTDIIASQQLVGYRHRSPMKPNALTQITLVKAAKHLASRDRDLASILERLGPPPLWARPRGFPTLVKIILEQQVSLASAASIFARLEKSVVPFHPARMIELGEPHLKSQGLTRQKTAYCLHLAQSLHEKRLSLSRLTRMSDEEARSALMDVKGIGSWSADVYLLMAMGRADIWPATDLALAVAVKNLKQLDARPTPGQLIEMAEGWRPFRSVAARMLWQLYLARK